MSEDPCKAWAHPKYHKIWRLIGKALILLAVCVGLIDTYLWFRILDTRPAHPDPSQGACLRDEQSRHLSVPYEERRQSPYGDAGLLDQSICWCRFDLLLRAW